jgi:antitoxin (DNA-binding transcriptional repressor) of toxin-antitoxin stability system
METAGSFEAKTHFSRRLDRVARGEEIGIPKRTAEGQAGLRATSSWSDTGSTPKARWRPYRSAW